MEANTHGAPPFSISDISPGVGETHTLSFGCPLGNILVFLCESFLSQLIKDGWC